MCCIFYNLLKSQEGKERMWRGARILLLLLLLLPQGRQSEANLMEIHVSYFFPCRSAISCSSPHPFRTGQTTQPIPSSCCNLYMTSVCTMPSSAVPHVKSRCPQYPGSNIKRFPVPDDKVDWSQNWRQYDPASHTNPSVAKKPVWADPDIE